MLPLHSVFLNDQMDESSDPTIASPAKTIARSDSEATIILETDLHQQPLRAALEYIQDVEALFYTRPIDYERFLANMRFWSGGEFGAEEVRWRMGQLLGTADTEMFERFMFFRPEDYTPLEETVIKKKAKTVKTKGSKLPPSATCGKVIQRRPRPILQEAVLLLKELSEDTSERQEKREHILEVLQLYASCIRDHEVVVADIKVVAEEDITGIITRLLELLQRGQQVRSQSEEAYGENSSESAD
jgi:hypothetical protein